MSNEYVLTTDGNGDLAIRTVVAEESSTANSTDVITATTDGKLAIRVVGSGGGGGGDVHNKGYYATPEALRTAYPTAQPGDFAIVESTDTVWVWDSDTNNWKDGDTKGQVTSVNNQTGAVVLTAGDVGAATTAQGTKADTAVQPGDLATVATTGSYTDLTNTPTIPAAQVNSDWNSTSGVSEILNKPTLATVATTGAYSDLSGTPTIPDPTQVSTLPTASADELGNIYQFIGTTDANYTNGYFYKCVSDGQQPATYSWSNIQVQASSGGLPSQTGNAGKFLTTDGTDVSWSDKPLVNNATGTNSVAILGTATNNYAVCIGQSAQTFDGGGSNIAIGYYSKAHGNRTVCIGASAKDASGNTYDSVVIGGYAETSAGYTVAIGNSQKTTAQYAIQIGAWSATNSDANTFKVANHNGNYEMMSADGTIPEARLADTTNATQGQVLTLDSNNNAVWATPSGGGGSATATTATLAANAWSSNSQTLNVTGVTSSNIVFVMPAPATQGEYNRADIQCTAQGSGTLTFTCANVPTTAITVNIIIM